MAHPAQAGYEQHAGGNVSREDGRIVAGAAPQACGVAIKLAAGLLENLDLRRVHGCRWYPGEQLGFDAAPLLGADFLEPFGKRGDDPPDGGLIQVTAFEGEGDAPQNHIYIARYVL